jgi:mycothiol synthase
MIGAPGSSGVPTLRPPTPAEADALQAVWEESHLVDDPGGRPRGGWSVDPWATRLCVLALDARVVGIAAVRAEPPPAAAVAARVALELDARTPDLADLLVAATIDLARAADGRLMRLYVPRQAEWSMAAARRAGFAPARSIFHMLLPGSVSLDPNNVPAGVRIRSMHAGEEPAILAALNRAWAGTWDFVPIRPELLERDLEGQRAGMLLAVDAVDDTRILATCHAVFDPADENPDGSPRAWISNLTVDPAQRGRGLGRAMLLAGLASLRERGAGSIALGVDAGDPTPLRLYQSVGFQTVSSMEAWDKSLRA